MVRLLSFYIVPSFLPLLQDTRHLQTADQADVVPGSLPIRSRCRVLGHRHPCSLARDVCDSTHVILVNATGRFQCGALEREWPLDLRAGCAT